MLVRPSQRGDSDSSSSMLYGSKLPEPTDRPLLDPFCSPRFGFFSTTTVPREREKLTTATSSAAAMDGSMPC